MKRPKLKAYQEKAVRKAVHFNGRMLNADEPGLGKSLETLAYQVRHNKRWPMVVVCPAIAKYVWYDECRKHYGIPATILSGRTPPPPGRLPHSKVYVINYENVAGTRRQKRTWATVLRKLKPGLVVIDEGHRVKNPTARCTKAIFGVLCRKVKRVMVLTGTPMPNGRPVELLPIVSHLRPDVFGNRWDYLWRYCGPRKGFAGHWTYDGASNLQELNDKLLKTVMIRRRKEDVLDELPPKTQIVVRVDIANRSEYDRAHAELRDWLMREHGKKKSRRATTAIRKAKTQSLLDMVTEFKAKAVKEWIKDYLESTGGKLLVFGHHVAFLEDLNKAFKNSVLVNGKTPRKERWTRTERFNNDPKCHVMFGNYIAAGTAWSCRSTSTVLLAEPIWVPGDIDQAVDRVRGIGRGQKGVPTTIYALLARDTIEEKIWSVTLRKRRDIEKGIDGATGNEVFRSVERELLFGG